MGLTRAELAIELLKEHQTISINDLRIGYLDYSSIYVTGWTQYSYIENLTKTKALLELKEIKLIYAQILEDSVAIRNLLDGKKIKYNLVFNHGMGSTCICSEVEGITKWEMKLKE